MRHSITLLVFGLFLPLLYSNVLPNPGFEEWQDGLPVGWELYKADPVSDLSYAPLEDGAHGGAKCLKLSDAWAGAEELMGIRTKEAVRFEPGKRYLFSMWYKNNAGAFSRTNAVMIELPSTEEYVLPMCFERSPAARMNWKHYRCLLPPIPAERKEALVSIGLAGASRDILMVDDVSLRPATAKEIEKYSSPSKARIGAIPEFKPEPNGEATGFIHTERIQNAWWLVGPEGKRFWSIGCAAAYPQKENKGLARKAGNKGKYRRKMMGLLKQWGFNSVATASDKEFLKLNRKEVKKGGEAMLLFAHLSLFSPDKADYRLSDMRGEKRLVFTMIDPYNPAWREAARKKVAEVAKRYRDAPWFGGYLVGGMLLDLSRLPFYLWGEHSGKHFIAWLREKYADDISKLNKAWCTPAGRRPCSYASFEELAARKAEPLGYDDPALGDFQAFAQLLFKEYVDFTLKTIKEADPNHLVLSNSVRPGQVMSLKPYFEAYNKFDAVALSIAPRGDVTGFDGGELDMILRLHLGCRKPLLVISLSIAARDSGLYEPPFRVADMSLQSLESQDDRAAVYRGCLTQMASLPYVLGVHWHQWHDVDMKVMRINCGLVNSKDEPYSVLVETMREIHGEIIEKKGLAPSSP